MIIHGARPSPFVRKVVVFATEKEIATEVRTAGFGRGGEGYLKGSPFGKIPVLEDGDFLLCDSTAIITYMDALYPEPNLIPTEAKARARTIWYEEFGDTVVQAAGQKIFFNRAVARALKREPDLAAADRAEAEEMPKIYDYLESALPDDGWLIAGRFTLADLAAASPIINVTYVSDGLRADRWPRVAEWMARVKVRPSVAAAMELEADAIAELLNK